MNSQQSYSIQLDRINEICKAVMGTGRPRNPIVKKIREDEKFPMFMVQRHHKPEKSHHQKTK